MEHVALITLNFWRTLPLNSLLADAIVPDRAAIMKIGIKVGGTKDVSASIVQCTSYKSQLFFSFSRIKKIAPLRPGKNLRNLIAEIYLAKIGQGISSICTHLKSYVIHHICTGYNFQYCLTEHIRTSYYFQFVYWLLLFTEKSMPLGEFYFFYYSI